MRLTLYNAIIARLSRIIVKDGLPYYSAVNEPTGGDSAPDKAILSYNLWNENIDTLTKQRAFLPPAVFIEFLPVQWRQLGNRVQQAEAVFRLHIITATLATSNSAYADEANYRFILIRSIEEALVGMTGINADLAISFNHCTHTESVTDHNHEQVCEDIETWKVHIIDQSAAFNRRYIYTPKDVTLDDGNIFVGAFD